MHRAQANDVLLIVDDDVVILTAWQRALQREGIEVELATNAREALELLRQHAVTAVITDYEMPGESGLWLLEQVESQFPEARRILSSGSPVGRGEHIPVGRVVQEFLPKPVTPEQMLELVRSIRRG